MMRIFILSLILLCCRPLYADGYIIPPRQGQVCIMKTLLVAKKSIWIYTFKLHSPAILDILQRKARHGVYVVLMVGKGEARLKYYKELHQAIGLVLIDPHIRNNGGIIFCDETTILNGNLDSGKILYAHYPSWLNQQYLKDFRRHRKYSLPWYP